MADLRDVARTSMEAIRDWAWIPAALLLLGLGSVAMLIGSNLIRERLIAGRIDLVRAVGDVQTRTAISHLWVEELVTGDEVDRAEIADHLERCVELMDLIVTLEDTTASWLVAGPDDADLPILTERARAGLEHFSRISRDRQTGFDQGLDVHIGSPIDVEYDAVFNALLDDLRGMERIVKEQLRRAEVRSDQLFRVILMAWIAIVALACFGIWGRERRRREAEHALHESEAQLLQAQKMEAVGRLAGGIAHDINNHLAAITAQCELVKIGAGDEPVEGRMNSILSTASRSSELIKRLLAFSRQQPVVRELIDVNATVGDLESMLTGLIGEDITLSTTLATNLRSVSMDPSQLEQIILNLVVNARDAMPRGGSISIETQNRAIEPGSTATPATPAPGSWVVLRVTDTGEGVPNEIQDRIFEPFFTTKDTSSGSGLGLATIHGIVRQNRGHVTVESILGEGATFRVFLPRSQERVAEERVEHTPHAPETHAVAASILLVEDNDDLRVSTREILTSMGHRVTTAMNAEQALELFPTLERPVDLLLTDVIMPGMDGKQLADRLREHAPDLPVLFVSGYTDDVILDRGVDQHGANFLPKPFSAAGLAAKLELILGKEQRGSRAS